jgi:NADH-quinone oxidoreductase subunit E
LEILHIDYPELFTEFTGTEGDLIPILQRVQQEQGYLSGESLHSISRFLKISENRIYGVASFYSQFRFTPPGRNTIKICLGTACHVLGGQVLRESLERTLGITPGEATPDGRFDFQQVACLGCCALAPVLQVNGDIHGKMTASRLDEILATYL